jgi:hypothetical protein
MTFVPVANTCQVELRYSLFGEAIENVLYFTRFLGVNQAQNQNIAEWVADWWEDQLRTIQRDDLTLREVYSRCLTSEDSHQYTDTRYTGYAGEYTSGNPLPGSVSFAVSFRTGFAGRSNRGRNFACALSTVQTDANQVTSTYRDAIVGIYEQFLQPSPWISSSWAWVVVSRWNNHEQREFGIATPVVTVLAVNDDLDSQRKRLAGRG